jgi:hypothetical protein
VAVTLTSLREAYPEFENAPDAVVTAAIARAEGRVDEEVLGDQYDQTVLLMACHEISISPYGQDLRLTSDDGETPYKRDARELLRAAGASWRVLG